MVNNRMTASELLAAIHANCNHREHPCACVHRCDQMLACDCVGVLCTMCEIDSTRGCDHVPECDAQEKIEP